MPTRLSGLRGFKDYIWLSSKHLANFNPVIKMFNNNYNLISELRVGEDKCTLIHSLGIFMF